MQFGGRMPWRINRRRALWGGGIATGIGCAFAAYDQWFLPRADCFIARHQRYAGPLIQTIRDGLLATGFDPRRIVGKNVLLKPNMVEPTRDAPQMTTHPAVVEATIAVFRDWRAKVRVGEAPGHVRDTDMALRESEIEHAIRETGVSFADLNYEETYWQPNRGRASKLEGFYFPKSVVEADLIVSLPKMKTHHWMGVTAALKNMYGVIPGSRYGWPKNVLHHNGIPETVFDINASIPPMITIVDGIVCMEGDGPIMGTAKPMGLLLIGTNAPAVDATVCRIMGLDPTRIPYLKQADPWLGPIHSRRITQQGEAWQPLVDPFQILNRPHLLPMRAGDGPLVT